MRNVTRLAIVVAVVAFPQPLSDIFTGLLGLMGACRMMTACRCAPGLKSQANRIRRESPYEKAEGIGKVTDKKLREISGITYSKLRPGTWWIHNDSGDAARIAAIDSRGNLLAAFRVVGAVNEDWEDIATGPGSDGSSALYIADIGDNGLKRDFVVVYQSERT